MADPAGYGLPVLLDNSAWSRIGLGRLTGDAAERFVRAVRDGDVIVCPPFALEALYSARDAAGFRALEEELASFPQAIANEGTWRLAAEAQRALTEERSVSHRVKAIDLLIAAVAHQNACGVLHYDHDYDVIAAHTPLTFPSVWVAERGEFD
jgi:predicted nucleic acid-binding protein